MRIVNQRTEMVPLGALKPHPKNPNQGNIGLIGESISHNGFYGALVVQQSTGHILRGNHTWQAARQAGATEIPVTYVDVDDETALRILLVDNRATREGTDDSQALAELLQELAQTPAGLEGSGYDGDALDELLADLGQMQPQMQGDPDAVPDVPEDQEPLTKRGDIIRLGRHMLGCIDSTSLDDVRRLLGGVTPDMVWTDPPYGINIVRKGFVGGGAAYDIPFGGTKKESAEQRRARLERVRGSDGATRAYGSPGSLRTIASHTVPTGEYEPVIGDQGIETAVKAYEVCAALDIPVMIFWGGNYYASALPNSSCWIVWDKENTGNFADAELAWTNQGTAVRIFRHMWNGLLKDSERGEKRIAPTQKPVALAEWCFAQYGKESDVVLDLFGGSGTCLIAAERTGRICYMAELSEHYCDCIIQRWEQLTGQKAERPARDHERIPAGAGRL